MSIIGNTNPEYIAVAMSPNDDISHLSTSIVDGGLYVQDDPTHDPDADADDDDDDYDDNEITALTDVEKSSINNSHNDDVDEDDDDSTRLKNTATRILKKYDINKILKPGGKKGRLALQLGILFVILLLIIIVSFQIKKVNHTTTSENLNNTGDEDGHVDSSKPPQNGNNGKSVFISCNNGEYELTLSEWLNQEYTNSASLCDPSVS